MRQMEAALQEFHWGIPFSEAIDGHFVPVFKRAEDVRNVAWTYGLEGVDLENDLDLGQSNPLGMAEPSRLFR